MSSQHFQLSLHYMTNGADNSTLMLVYYALRNERERLTTDLAKEHADQEYEKAAITNDELERINNTMGSITRFLSNECQRLELEILRLTQPKEYEQRKITHRDKQNELNGLYDERFFDKPYNPEAEEKEEGGPANE